MSGIPKRRDYLCAALNAVALTGIERGEIRVTRAWEWMANLKIDFNLEGESNHLLPGILNTPRLIYTMQP